MQNPRKKKINWLKYTSPPNFYKLVNFLLPWLWLIAGVAAIIGLYLSFFVAPPDYQQGNSYRILYIHVPTAWMGMFIYLLMAAYSIIYLVWGIKLASVLARSLAPTGAIMTFISLWTGAFWGAPTWGAYWVWDARLTSSLILLFLYLGYLALHAAAEDEDKGGRMAALLAIIGAVNVPIIYMSVKWWNTLHQGMTITLSERPSMAPEMFYSLLFMLIATWSYCAAIALARARTELLTRDSNSRWVQEIFQAKLTQTTVSKTKKENS